VTSKGQITIPKAIRDALALETGDRVAFRLREDGVVEMEPETVDLLSLCGMIKPKVRGVSVEQMNQAIRSRGGRL
jgi:antitoxin PrlF